MKDILVHRQELRPVRDGRMEWTPVSETLSLEPERSAIIIVDMWDRHWCTGANLRGAPLADRIDRAVRRARSEGVGQRLGVAAFSRAAQKHRQYFFVSHNRFLP